MADAPCGAVARGRAFRHDAAVSRVLLCWLVAACLLAGCSLQRFAAKTAGRALAGGGTAWSADDDPELVREAMPFALKTIESLLAAAPDDPGLLLAAATGFTQYAYGFLAVEADELESEDLAAATALRARARRLLARATSYGLRGLEIGLPGLRVGAGQMPTGSTRRSRGSTATRWRSSTGPPRRSAAAHLARQGRRRARRRAADGRGG